MEWCIFFFFFSLVAESQRVKQQLRSLEKKIMDLKLASLEETQQNQLVNELKRIQEGLREVRKNNNNWPQGVYFSFISYKIAPIKVLLLLYSRIFFFSGTQREVFKGDIFTNYFQLITFFRFQDFFFFLSSKILKNFAEFFLIFFERPDFSEIY